MCQPGRQHAVIVDAAIDQQSKRIARQPGT